MHLLAFFTVDFIRKDISKVVLDPKKKNIPIQKITEKSILVLNKPKIFLCWYLQLIMII